MQKQKQERTFQPKSVHCYYSVAATVAAAATTTTTAMAAAKTAAAANVKWELSLR